MRKKNIITLITTLLLTFCITLTLTAKKVVAEKTPTKALTMFVLMDITAPEGKVFKETIDMFKAKYPNIEIEADFAYGEPYHQKIAAMIANNNLPDVIYMWPGGRSSNLMEYNKVQNLYPFLENDSIKKRLFKEAIKPQRNGKLYELPHAMTEIHVFYANKRVLRKHGLKVPKTYQELKKISKILHKKGVIPVLMANKDSWVNQSCLFSMIVGRIAGDKWIMDAVEGKAKFTDKPFVDSLKFVQQIFKDNVIPSSSLQTAYGEAPRIFMNDKAAFFIDGAWRVNALTSFDNKKKQKDIEMLVFPKIPGEKYHNTTTRVVGTGFGMNAKLKGKKAEQAWKWISFFADRKAAKHRLKEQGLIPTVKIDSSDLKLENMVKKRIVFSKKYKGMIVLDNVLDSEPIILLNQGLQKLAMNMITPEKLAAQFENAVRGIPYHSKTKKKNPNALSMIALIDVTAPEGRLFKKQIEMFNTKYPNIEIEADYAYGEPFHQKIAAMAASGDLPDVIYMWPGGRSSNLMKYGLVQDLYPFLKNDSIKKRLFRETMDPQYDGKLYELPHAMTSTHIFFANKKVLRKYGLKIPKTYKELKKISKKLRAKGIEPVLMANKDSWVNQACFFSMVVGRIAGDEWLKKAVNGEAKFTDKPFIKALKFTERVFKDKIISPDSVHVSYGEVPNLFAAGKAAFMIDGEWRVNALTGLIKEKNQKDIEMLVFPKIPGEKYHNTTTRVVGTGFGMNSKLKGKKAEQAWKWISFFADSKAAKQRLKEFGLIPAVEIDSSNLKIESLVKKRMKISPKYKGTIVLDNYINSDAISLLNTDLQRLSVGAITVEELAAKFEKAVRQTQKRN